MSHVFISYVRENAAQVDKLREDLQACGINVWLDRYDILPGHKWQDAIRKAIKEGSFFLACFSEAYLGKDTTYMNEELVLAIEELRRRPINRAWFIPVLLSECNIPDRSIGAGDTLNSIQQVFLYRDWNDGIRRILSVVAPGLQPQIDLQRESLQQQMSGLPFSPLKNQNPNVIRKSLIAEATYILAQVNRDISAYYYSKDQVEFFLEGDPLSEEVLTQLKNLEKKYGIPISVSKYIDRGYY